MEDLLYILLIFTGLLLWACLTLMLRLRLLDQKLRHLDYMEDMQVAFNREVVHCLQNIDDSCREAEEWCEALIEERIYRAKGFPRTTKRTCNE